MSDEINIEGLSKAAVLAALFNGSRQQGMGFLNAASANPMTEAQAQEEIDARADGNGWRSYFDYLRGRVMKVDIGGDTFDPYLYDRDNGRGAAAAVIASLRQQTKAA